MTPTRPDRVRAIDGLKANFLRRHRRNPKPAEDAWRGLIQRSSMILLDPTFGEPIPNRLIPPKLAGFSRLYLIPELPHRFRAIYTIHRERVEDPLDVVVVWIGSHAEYEQLFGYSTS